MSKWYYEQDGFAAGPATESEMHDLISKGQVTRTTRVWHDGLADWAMAGETQLAPHFAGVPPPLPSGAPASAPTFKPVPPTLTAAAPTVGAGTGAAAAVSSEPGVLPLAPLWTWLRRFLYAYMVAVGLSALASLVLIGFLARLEEGGFATPSDVTSSAETVDGLSGLAFIIYIIVYVFCAIFFLRVIFRAMRNLHVAGAKGVSTPPGWAVGWFFIPIANLWKPLQAVRQIWKASFDPVHPDQVEVPAQIGWWWALWLITSFVAFISRRLAASSGQFSDGGPVDREALVATARLELFGSLLEIPMALLALWFLRRIVEVQDRQVPQRREHR